MKIIPIAGCLLALCTMALALACPILPPTDPGSGPAAGNPDGHYPVPAEARAVDASVPDQIIGTGTPASVTEAAFIAAVAKGGKITFNGGKDPFVLALRQPAKVYNDQPDLVIDGGGLVTLSGSGVSRILYMNTGDKDLVWTTSHAQNQEHPQLTVQNLTFIDGNASLASNVNERGGGGAIWAYGGRLKVVNCRFFNNLCVDSGPDVGGGAIRAFAQYNGLPVYVVGCTFGGAAGYGNKGANGGALSSIGVSWAIYNSLFSYNAATGRGGNPADFGTPGGGSGGAIYNDGNTMQLSLYGCKVEHNTVNAFGSAIFFVSNDHSGSIHLEDCLLRANSGGSWYKLPGISCHDDTPITAIASTIE